MPYYEVKMVHISINLEYHVDRKDLIESILTFTQKYGLINKGVSFDNIEWD